MRRYGFDQCVERTGPFQARMKACPAAWPLRVSAFLMLFLLFIVSGASASEPRLEGEGVLGERNRLENSLQVGGALYFFDESSVIVGRSGELLTLDELDVHDVDGEPGLRPLISGRFTATEVGTRHVIQRLELIESPR